MLARLAELDAMCPQGVRGFRLPGWRPRCSISAPTSCRPSISTSARTRSIATRPALRRRAARTVIDEIFLHRHLVRAHPVLHHGGSLAVAASACRTAARQRASAHLSDDARGLARSGAGREVEDASARCAASSPARWSSRAPTSASAPACRPRRTSMPRAEYVEAIGLDLAEISITSSARLSRGRAPPAPSPCPTWRAWRWCRLAPGDKCARCWQVLEEVGKSAQHPLLCGRCEGAVRLSHISWERLMRPIDRQAMVLIVATLVADQVVQAAVCCAT